MKTLMGLIALLLATLASPAQEAKDTLRILFPFDEATLTTEARAKLDAFISTYKGVPSPSPLQLRGHTDAVGSLAYNEELSKRRTFTVHNYLLNNGVLKTSVSLVEGYGERVPLNDNHTPEARSLNRRVEIIWITPTTPPPPPPPSEPEDTVQEFSREVMDTVKEGSTLRLRNINFYGGRHTFLPQATPALEELLQVMKTYPSLVIEIQGHICCRYGFVEDGMDYDAGDMRLSHNRARAVYYYLADNGIDKKRMTYRGFAGANPLVWPERDEADRTLNRRVEIKIVKR